MICPLCKGVSRARKLAGASFDKCESCGSIWIEREAILRLRGKKLHEHPLLVDSGSNPERSRFDELPCPSCAAPMRVYDYRGGSVTVDQCQRCDRIFLDAGELARILREWEEGFELPDDAKHALMMHHLHRGAETEGPGWTLLLAIVLLVLGVASRLLGIWSELGIADPFVFLGVVGLALIVGILVWRRAMVRRREEHVRHVRKATAYAKGAGKGPPERP